MIDPANRENSLVVSIAAQKFLTKPEKTGMRKAVVLQNYRAFLHGKHSVQSRNDTIEATQIVFCIVRNHIADPIDLAKNRFHLGDFLPIPENVGTRPIDKEVEPFRPGSGNGRKYARRQFGAIKRKYRDGCID